MKLCPKCTHSPMPFVLVTLVAGIAAFTTWLTLSLSVDTPWVRITAAAIVFVAVGGTLLHYVLACLKRHCRHGTHDHRVSGHSHVAMASRASHPGMIQASRSAK